MSQIGTYICYRPDGRVPGHTEGSPFQPRRQNERGLEYRPVVFCRGIATRTTSSGGAGLEHSEIVSFLWGVADLIRDSFKRGKNQDVILPFTVLRRLDCVLAPTKGAVMEAQVNLQATDRERV